MMLVLTAAGLLVVGWRLAVLLRNESEMSALEQGSAAITIAFGLWIGVDWIFALTHTLVREALIARTVVAWVIAAVLLVRRPPVWRRTIDLSRTAFYAFVLPLALWVIFIAWRGAIVPPLTHDALAYHLPKAVLYARAHGFIDASRLSDAFHDVPVNYELLLSDVLLLGRGDQLTEWLGTILYVCFLIASGTLAWRWWRDRTATLLTMLLLAGAPVLLLHSGADKNDLLVGAFTVLAMVWAGRYWTTGEQAPLLLLATSTLIAIGTKPQAAFLAAALLPFVIVRMLRDLRAGRSGARQVAIAVAFGAVAFFVLGGWTYVDNNFSPPGQTITATTVAPTTNFVHYGDWSNLWQGPYVLIAAPFAPNAFWLSVPWESQPWFWKRYEIFFSHLGVPFALCFLGAPFAARAWREREGRAERLAIGAAALAAFIALLPVVFYPHGMYTIGLPRYAMFFAPAVIAWTAGALMRSVSRAMRNVVIVAGTLLFVFNAVDVALHDTFAPLDYVLLARMGPGTRYIPFDPHRATSIVDQLAGPYDVIALDVTWGSWIHPAFGAHLTRPVYFIPPGDGPPHIPERADWVVVERAFATTWGSPEMKTLSSARQMFGKYKPGRSETRVIEYLKRDPRFVLVHEDVNRDQAVFRRVRRTR